MKLYFTEKHAKFFFFLGLWLEAFALFGFCTKNFTIATVLVGLCSGAGLLFTLGYPFFYFILTRYYPSGYKSPVEKIPSLASDYNLATMNEFELIKLSSELVTNEIYKLITIGKRILSTDSLGRKTIEYKDVKPGMSILDIATFLEDVEPAQVIPSLACIFLECPSKEIRMRASGLLQLHQASLATMLSKRSELADEAKEQLEHSTPISFE